MFYVYDFTNVLLMQNIGFIIRIKTRYFRMSMYIQREATEKILISYLLDKQRTASLCFLRGRVFL